MRPFPLITLAAFLTCVPFAAGNAWAIAPGDLIVYQTRNDVTGPSNAAPVSLLDITPTGSVVETFSLLNAISPLYSTTNDPIANLALSNNNTEVSFPGWTTKGSVGTLLGLDPSIPRGVGTLGPSGNYAQPATYLPTSTLGRPDQPHAAFSPDGTNWYFGDTTGIYYNNATTPLTGSDATLSIKGFANKTYALHTLDTPFLNPNGTDAGPNSGATVLSSITPTTAAPGITSITFTNLLTLPTAAHDFLLLSSFNQAPDTLYVTTNLGISKFASPGGFGGGAWIAEGTISLPGATAITGQFVKGVGAELFVTVNNGPGPTTVSTLDELIDTAAPNVAITAAAPSILLTATNLDTFQGIAFAPVPEPATLSLLTHAAHPQLTKPRKKKKDARRLRRRGPMCVPPASPALNAPPAAPSPTQTSYSAHPKSDPAPAPAPPPPRQTTPFAPPAPPTPPPTSPTAAPAKTPPPPTHQKSPAPRPAKGPSDPSPSPSSGCAKSSENPQTVSSNARAAPPACAAAHAPPHAPPAPPICPAKSPDPRYSPRTSAHARSTSTPNPPSPRAHQSPAPNPHNIPPTIQTSPPSTPASSAANPPPS